MPEQKNRLARMFCAICGVIPFAMAVFLALMCLSGIYALVLPRYRVGRFALLPMDRKIMGALLLGCMAFLCRWILRGTFEICERRLKNAFLSEFFPVFILFTLAFLTRFSLLRLFEDSLQPFSDFLSAWELAHGDLEKGNFAYYTLFPAYLNFAAFERTFLQIFGDRYVNPLYFNALLASFTCALIYRIGGLLGAGKRQAMLSALLYAFMPANVFYCAVGSPDFLAILFNVIGAAFFLRALKTDETRRRVVFALCGGAGVGIGSAYKVFGLTILIAFIITLAFQFLPTEEGWKRPLMVSALCLLVAFGAYKIAIAGVTSRTESMFNVELDFRSSVPHFLLIGLNTQGEGQFRGDLSHVYVNEYLNNGYDAKAAADVAYRSLLDDWSRNAKDAPLMFIKKMVWAWQDDGVPLWYFANRTGITVDENANGLPAQVYSGVARFGGSVAELFYLFLMLSAMLACFAFAFARTEESRLSLESNGREQNASGYAIIWLLLIIFGYFCITVLSEGQSRYKNLIMPFICLISGYGINAALKTARLMKK